jgi:integrase
MPRISEPIKKIETGAGTRYVATADGERGPEGKRRQVRKRFSRRAEAVKWLGSMRAETADEWPFPAPEAPAVEDESHVEIVDFAAVAEPWLAVKRASVRYVTFVEYESAVTIWAEHFDGKPVSEITKADVQQLVSKYHEDGKSVRRTSFLLMVCRSVFEEALDEGHANRNPARLVKPLGKPAKSRGALSADEYRKVQRAALGTEWEALWLLTLAGLRRSEVLGLQWQDVDFEGRTLTICRGRVQIGGTKRVDVDDPKTRNGFRTLPLPKQILDSLKQLRSEHMQRFGLEYVRGEGWLGVDAVGRPIRPEVYSDEWKLLLQSAQVKEVTLHEARHTSVSLARESGLSDMEVAQWHGHDENVMRQTYSHASQQAVKAVGEALFG